VEVDTALVADGTFMENTMRHPVTTLLAALICVTAAASISDAQSKSAGTTRPQHILPTNRWVTRPTPIKLTADQQKKLDSVSVKYAAEEEQISKQAGGKTDVNMVIKMMNLAGKYQNIVRGILDPAQQAVFDKNIQASVFGP
jgi:hypothetical protein